MQTFETAQQLSEQLTSLLLQRGERQTDKIQYRVTDPEFGTVKLNDYWNGFHIAHEGLRHYQDPDSFYSEGNIPILGLGHEKSDVTVFTFRPVDVCLGGLGSYLVQEFPEDLKGSELVVATKSNIIVPEPINDDDITDMLRVLTG